MKNAIRAAAVSAIAALSLSACFTSTPSAYRYGITCVGDRMDYRVRATAQTSGDRWTFTSSGQGYYDSQPYANSGATIQTPVMKQTAESRQLTIEFFSSDGGRATQYITSINVCN